MDREELEKEAEEQAFKKYPIPQNWDSINLARHNCYEEGYVDGAKSREKKIAKLEAQLTTKIIDCIRFHLCKQDDDYDSPIISPKFLSDTLDQMAMDGFNDSENNEGKAMVKTVLKDEESKKLSAKKEELERELERINTRLANKELEANLLNKFEIGKWYRFTIDEGLPEVIFKYSEDDFIRDDNLWVHKAFSETITKMQSSFEHRSSFFLIPIDDLDNVREIEECFVKHMIEDEISRLRVLADL